MMNCHLLFLTAVHCPEDGADSLICLTRTAVTDRGPVRWPLAVADGDECLRCLTRAGVTDKEPACWPRPDAARDWSSLREHVLCQVHAPWIPDNSHQH